MAIERPLATERSVISSAPRKRCAEACAHRRPLSLASTLPLGLGGLRLGPGGRRALRGLLQAASPLGDQLDDAALAEGDGQALVRLGESESPVSRSPFHSPILAVMRVSGGLPEGVSSPRTSASRGTWGSCVTALLLHRASSIPSAKLMSSLESNVAVSGRAMPRSARGNHAEAAFERLLITVCFAGC